ncbi:MAG TPA: NAD-dependent epimerase/dehydratase family protein [Phycisphaerae bacterium]|nr:NAD-dependent epimerase/dehydratase family protein [Phycisphaerae bacterium]
MEAALSQNGCAGQWLVLGASGFVGRATCRELKSRGFGVTEIDHATSGKNRRIDVHNLDALRGLFRELQPAVLISAVGHPPSVSESAIREFYRQSTLNVLDALRGQTSKCRVILLGSAAEYGNSPESGSREEDNLRPLSEYGRAKAEQFDMACRFTADGLDIMTARLFNPLGPGQDDRHFAGALMKRIHSGENPLRVDHANHLRDWIDIRDVANALVTLAVAADSPRVINICTGKSQTVGTLAAKVASVTGVQIQMRPAEISAGDLWRSVGNSERMHQLGFQPRYTLQQSLLDQWRSLV